MTFCIERQVLIAEIRGTHDREMVHALGKGNLPRLELLRRHVDITRRQTREHMLGGGIDQKFHSIDRYVGGSKMAGILTRILSSAR